MVDTTLNLATQELIKILAEIAVFDFLQEQSSATGEAPSTNKSENNHA